jgi:hypothetical protein
LTMTSTLLVPSCMTNQKFVVFGSRRNLQYEARLSLEQAPHHLNQGGGGTYNEKKHTVSRRLKRRKSTKLLFHERVEELRWISGTRAIRQAHIQKFLDDVIRHVTSYYSISSLTLGPPFLDQVRGGHRRHPPASRSRCGSADFAC